MGPTVFMRRDRYIAILIQLTGLSIVDCKQRLNYLDRPTPMLCLEYFDQVAKKCATLGDELWLWGFVTCFLGELIFNHDRMTIAIEVAEITLVVVTRQIDLALVVLEETYRGLDRILHRCYHFHGCGALVQVWLAGHLGMDILCPQKSAFETYCGTGHA